MAGPGTPARPAVRRLRTTAAAPPAAYPAPAAARPRADPADRLPAGPDQPAGEPRAGHRRRARTRRRRCRRTQRLRHGLAGGRPSPAADQLAVPPGAAAGGYRPPFAPHGPYAGGGPAARRRTRRRRRPAAAAEAAEGAVRRSARPPFSLVFVALGVVAALDLSNTVHVGPSAYFARALLVTVALGLLVGAWFGRARWLIALGLVLCVGAGHLHRRRVVDRVGNVGSDVVWTPTTLGRAGQPVREQLRRRASWTSPGSTSPGRTGTIAVEVNFGAIEVILPPEVDVTATVEVGAGEARVFGNSWSGVNRPAPP